MVVIFLTSQPDIRILRTVLWVCGVSFWVDSKPDR